MLFRSALSIATTFLVSTAFADKATVVPTSLAPIVEIGFNARGTYPVSTLPKLCVNGHIATATAVKTIELMRTIKSTCNRTDWNWDHIEQSAGVYDFSSGTPSFNYFFGTLCAQGYQQIFLATYNNTLYSSGVFTAIAAGANTTAFSNFGAALANRVKAIPCTNPIIEAFNEPNLVIWTTAPWPPANYSTMLTAFSAAVKSAQPSVSVLSGGVSPGGLVTPFIWAPAQAIAGGTFSNVNGYGLHPYNYNQVTPTLTPNPDQLLLDLQTFWKLTGSTAQPRPIAVTEWGYPYDAFAGSVTQAALNKQGVYIGWGMLNAIVANKTTGSPGVPYFAVYDLVDDGTSYTSDQNSFGLFFNGAASNGNPIAGASAYGIKPSGTAFQSITTAMDGATSYTIDYDLSVSATTISFPKPSGASFAVWTSDTTGNKSYSKRIGTFAQVTCKDLIGNSVTCNYSGGTLSATISTTIGPIIATALNVAPPTPPPPTTHLAPVFTRGRVTNQIQVGAGELQTRYHVQSTDTINGEIQLTLANFYVDNSGLEVAPGGTATVTASLEYPAGVCSPVTFPSGGVIPNGGTITGTVTASVPNGADAWWRVHFSGLAGLIYFSGQDVANGEGLAFGVTVPDQTVDCTPVISGTGVMYPIAAASAQTMKPTVCITGDSIGFGTNDGFTGTTSLLGAIERSIPTVGFVNTSTPSNFATGYIASHTGRNAIINASGCTTLIDQLGSNDILAGGKTAAQTVALKQTIWSYFPGKWIAVPTLEPVANSTDNWMTLVNQTPVPLCPTEVVSFNNLIRAFPAGMNQLLELSNVWSSSVDSCKWTVTPTPPYTTDGLHPSVSGYALVPPSGAINPALFH